jgi:hypothetical protein
VRWVGFGVAVGVAAGCGTSSAPSPFALPDDAGKSGPLPADGGPPILNAPPDDASVPGEWGGRCVDDGECDDRVECTHDVCDLAIERCHFVPEDDACDDGAYCNGVEACAPGVGCRPGPPVACSDNTACTIDACDEISHGCVHSVRDADGDGDPDGNCPPSGGDCNDHDPNVSSLQAEICADGLDNDCDRRIDESDCEDPAYDTCGAAFDVSASGQFPLSAAAAKKDYSAKCLAADASFRDLVVALHVPDGGSLTDIDVAVTASSGNVALATVSKCGDASSERACAAGVATPSSSHVARLKLRGLAKGVYALYVFAEAGGPLVLNVEYGPASPAPVNETCGTAAPLVPDAKVIAELTAATFDATTACGKNFGDLTYAFTLEEPRDVRLFATSEDAYGTPVVSLRRAPCDAREGQELTCRSGQNAELFVRALPPGHYFVDVGATGPSDVSLLLETAAPTVAPSDETCVAAPALPPAVTHDVILADHTDDLNLGCAAGAPDAAYALNLDHDSDVLLVLRIGDDDPGAVSLSRAACSSGDPLLVCATSETGPLTDVHRAPVRATARNVPAGDYRVVVESALGTPASVTAFLRPPSPPSLVAFSDDCATAQPIPPQGGLFNGTTANATDDFSASCDTGGGNAPDQLLSLHLDAPSRVVLDARGSSFAVILDVRTGGTCPGDEINHGCSAGYVPRRSFLDLDLDSGDYWVQIDGYAGATGAWTLDAFVAQK